ncbi:CPBP family intramembrane glutamic endopeptidase [Clostridium merdae]|uniref:CPBP family intramembrane glutamic endopeptidase n=1 Tax=Clostridium merdae TaxID=1958780 RepID=UPI000A26DFBE|nr:type II CAAX endopeptidase family protein [Clostridium merdae]
MKSIHLYLKRSELFQQKASSIQLKIPLAIAVYFALWLIGFGIGRFFTYAIFNALALDTNTNETLAFKKLIVCGTQIALFFLWVKFVEKRPVNSIGFQAKNPFRHYITGFVLGFGTISIVTLILFATGMITIQYESQASSYVILKLAIMAFGWMIQSASEEIAIRGWMIPRLEQQSSPLTAVFITAILFGILHLFSAGVTALSFLNLILSGVFFAGYAIKDGNIWGVCGLHFAWNFALGNIYGLPVSGFADNGIRLFQTQQIGSVVYTGGDFGPEGGLITTIVLLLAIAILTIRRRKEWFISNML